MMIDSLLMAMGVSMAAVVLVLVGLVRAHRRLRRDYRILADAVQDNSRDIAGLCSAALAVDSRIMANDKQMSDLLTQLADDRQADLSTHPYSGVLHAVRGGAGVNELMKNYGLSHDEAALLIRLHGSEV